MIRALIIMVEVNYSLKWPFISPNYFSFVQRELVAGPSLSNTGWMGHWSSAALLAPQGSVSVAERCEVWLPEPSWFSFHSHLVTDHSGAWQQIRWWTGISGLSPGGCQVVHLRFKKKKHFKSGLRVGWVSGIRRLASAECWGQMSSAQIVAFSQVSYTYLFLLLWLFLLTWQLHAQLCIQLSQYYFCPKELYCYILVFWGQIIVFPLQLVESINFSSTFHLLIFPASHCGR